MITWCVIETPDTCVGVVAENHELTQVLLLEGSAAVAERRMRRDFPAGRHDPDMLPMLQQQIRDYFAGRSVAFDVPVRLDHLTSFQKEVLKACRRIPPGRTLTYGQLAERLGHPRAARAVGNALARNPVPLVIPCHRVVASGGQWGGFSAEAGVPLKKRLLALEARR